MANETMRTFMLDGKKKGVTLDASTWKAVDWIADQQGVKWTDLAREWIAERIDQDSNMTRAVRSGVIDTLLQYPLFDERADQADPESELFDPLRETLQEVHRDEDLAYALDQAKEHGQILGHYSFGGFRITTGVSEYGAVAFYIENGVKDCPHVIITTRHGLDDFLAGSRKK